ncbi:MAG: hypothetical protein AMXMBFR7_04150 [Planctomycetota bacterium]
MTPSRPPAGVHKILLLNAHSAGEIRVAVVEDGELTEIFIERQSNRSQSGNIYKARIVNIEPSLQAAFVEIGGERNGFLHVSDCLSPDRVLAELPPPGAPRKPSPNVPVEEVPPPHPTVSAAASVSAPPDDAEFPDDEVMPNVAPDGTPLDGETAAANVSHGSSDQAGGKRRRRRRRGGRGRSGRARRAPEQAPMLAPGPRDGEGGPEDEPLEAPDNEAGEPVAYAEPMDEGAEPAPDPEPEPHTEAAAEAEPTPAVEMPPEGWGSQTPLEGTESGIGAAEPTAAAEAGETTAAPAAPESAATAAGPAAEDARRPERSERGGREGREGREPKRYKIEELLKRGQEILVQVAKEGLGQKGPALTSYLSIPGRYLVLMPAVARVGVSKRIGDEHARRALKEALADLQPPEGMGLIVRTAGLGRGKEDLKKDLDYLLQTWDTISKKARAGRAPALVYEEGDVITRVFRDIYTDDVAEVVVDDPVSLERARAFLREIAPQAEVKLRLHQERTPLFHRYGIEPQIQRLFHRKVGLESGGSIVIEQTEALTAIDVNSGRFREKRNQEDTILSINLEAAREVARQLRLRDIGGLVMIDFIDMESMDHRRKVEQELKRHLARDRARINVLPISPLGVVEMTRQRVRHSLRKALFIRCPYCYGSGSLKAPESLVLELMRELKHQCADPQVNRVRVSLNPEAAFEILNQFRRELSRYEEERGVKVEFHGDSSLPFSQWRLEVAKSDGPWVSKKLSEVDDYVRNN